jgi:cation:H+ antiporter
MAWEILSLLGGFVVLAVSGDQFVIGVGRLAAVARIRPSVVGAVVGGLGASLPDLVVASVASTRGAPQLAVGTLVGSNIANICLALGLAALVAPVRVDSRTVRREMPICVAAVALFAILAAGGLRRVDGFVLLVALGAAIGGLVGRAGHGHLDDELELEVRRFFRLPGGQTPSREVVRTLAAVAFMIAGAELLVHASTALARRVGLAEGLLGLTIVAVGTSTPLIAIAIQAARRGEHDLVAGNVLGSNLFIALAGGAIVALVRPGPAASVGPVPLWLMTGVTAAAWGFMARGSRVTRWEASVLIGVYVVMLPFVGR